MLSNLHGPARRDRRAKIGYMVSLSTDATATPRKPPGRSWPGPRPSAALPNLGPASARATPPSLSLIRELGFVQVTPSIRNDAAKHALELGYLTQTWLALSSDPAAAVSGGYR
jgi:hypothetical protein